MNNKLRKLLEKVLNKDTLTEDFVNEVEEVFNTAVELKCKSIKKELTEEMADALRDEIVQFKEKEINTVDKYLDELSEQIVEENKMVIEDTIDNAKNKSIVEELLRVFERFNINLSESDLDIVEQMKEKCTSYESRIDHLMKENIKIKEEKSKNEALRVFNENTEDLTEKQKDDLRVMLEDVDIDDIEAFKRKIDNMKKHFLNEDVEEDDDLEKKLELRYKDDVGRFEKDSSHELL